MAGPLDMTGRVVIVTGGTRGVGRGIARRFLEAGADVLETNTFGAHRFKLGPHGLEIQVKRINREGARIAREAAAGRAGIPRPSMRPTTE